ncbi:winged helix family two component transcriptional regulator [Gracilibacillus halophilus YIM-C55.5]|uniref:Winged helix family two component transcriptional regulator n=1 Tax=Gracilibacillus halophilus YIM-C55.5 TaxID=1308866 RepID=N4W7K5_9BACI|nr:response regulator transcription factor [Gracilibacillus halophilus]ENH96258.1 winged helix family two component transcriptional regulator [Gracilibacillus halophilus YIM-C55.5]
MKTNEAKILIVEDDTHILEFLKIGLENEGYQVRTAKEGMMAINLLKEFEPHVVILDIMMPGMDGFEVCRMIKKSGVFTSIIMLSAKDEVDDRIKGLTIGADDYLVKPFSFEELLARITARLRNQFPDLFGEVKYGPFTIDERRKEFKYHENILTLSPTEYELLKYLVINHGMVISKLMILDKVWGYTFQGEENIVEVYIRSLRDKLGDKQHQIIRTIRGAGYRIDVQ